MKNIYVYIFIIGVILFIAGLWLSQRVEGFQSTAGLILAGIGADGTVYLADSGLTNIPNWSNISGNMVQISGSMGQIVGVNSSQQVWYTKQASAGMASTWTQIPGTATKVAFDFPKLVAIMGSSVGYISDVNVANPAFTTKNAPVGFKSIDISLGSAYAIGTDNKIYKCADITASSWSWTDITGSIMGKSFTQVSCDAGNVAVVTESNELYYARNSNTWFQLTGRAVKGVSVRSGMLYAVGTDNKIYYSPSQIPNATWSSLSGTVSFSYIDCFLPINAQIISERTAGNASCADPTYEVVGAQCMSPCPSGYTANGTTCVQGSTARETSNPTVAPDVIYNCPSGELQLSGAVCSSTQDNTNISNNAPLKEAYAVNGSFTQAEAQAKCESYGATLASYQQVTDAQAAGASWRVGSFGLVPGWGWIADDATNIGQISYAAGNSTTVVPKQAGGTGKSGAICYGVKPPLSVAGEVLPFNKPFNVAKWNQATQCEFGYRVVFNASCKSGCPIGSISDPTYCTYEAVPKVSKAKKIVNFTCPDGYDDPSVTSCSKFTTNNTSCTTTPTCYQKCPPGYTRNGTTCTASIAPTPRPSLAPKPNIPKLNKYTPLGIVPPIGGGVFAPICTRIDSTLINGLCIPSNPCQTNYTLTNLECVPNTPCPSDYTFTNDQCVPNTPCPSDYTLTNGQCVPNNPCPPNYTSTNGQCVVNSTTTTAPASSTRQTQPATFIAPCDPGYTLIGTACYKECDTGLNDVGTKCQKPSITRTTSETTITKPTRPLCAADQQIINQMCVKKCPQGAFSTDTSCSTSSVARTVVSARFTAPCNSNEDFLNGMCVSRCAPGESRVGSTCVPGKQRIDSPVCKSSNYGNYKRWLCDSQKDLDKLLKDPSPTTTYVNDNDQVCITSSPTTMMYYCQTVAETNSGGAALQDIQDVAGTTCSNLLKNYIDLSGSIVSLQLIRSGMDDGSVSLAMAKDKLNDVYNNIHCNTTTSDLCTTIKDSISNIRGDMRTIISTSMDISGPISQAVQARQDLLASIQKFQCSP
jgi:Tectonin domain